MFEQVQMLRTFLRMAWLYRWFGAILAIALSLIGWIGVQLLPDQYEVKSKVFLDSRSMLRPLLQGIAFTNSALSDSALLLSRTLLTRPNLEEVARRADLDLGAKTPEEFDKLIKDLASDIKIASSANDDIYELSYHHRKAKTAKLVIDELLNIFMEQSLGDARKDTAVTQKFLDEQISAYEKRLIEAEDRLKQFKQRNVAVLPGSQGDYFKRLEEAHNQLRESQLALEEGKRRRDQFKAQSSSAAGSSNPSSEFGFEEGGGGDASDPEVAYFDTKIADLTSRIDEMLLNFTDKHPDIIAMKKLKTDLEKKKKDKQDELEKKAKEAKEAPAKDDELPTGGVGSDPFSQQINLQLAEANANVAALESRVQEYERRVKELEQKVDTVPEVEAELARLNRDYTVTKQQYDELLKRRELAHMAQEANRSEDDVKIKVIEPPLLPLLPTGPNRLLFASLVLLAGLGVGGAAAVLLSQINPRVIDVPDLRHFSGLPVLGVVSMTANEQYRQQRRFEMMAFFSVLSTLIVVYLTQVLLYLFGVDLHSKLSSVIGVIA